jgi:hypothetical protein
MTSSPVLRLRLRFIAVLSDVVSLLKIGYIDKIAELYIVLV